MEAFDTVALFPMKLESERIKGKNFRNFCGQPLFLWMLNRLLDESSIQKILINTDARDKLSEFGIVDSEKILIRDRSKHLCGHDVSMNLIIEDDLNNISSQSFLMTHVTNPLLSASSIKLALSSYGRAIGQGFDSLFSVNKFQTRFYDFHAHPINHNPDDLIKTQDLEPWFEENSNLYIFSKQSFFKTNSRIGEKPFMFETAKFESVDIDNPADWEFAEMSMRFILEGKAKL